MKIYKVALSQEPPPGFVIRRTIIRKDGTKSVVLIRGSQSQCPATGSKEDQLVTKWMKQVAETPVPGFGVEKVGEDQITHSPEHYQQNAPNIQPLPEEETPAEEYTPAPQSQVSPMEQGFGV